MTNYRRSHIPGGSYFFTVALADRSNKLLTNQITHLKQAFREVKSLKPFDVVAIVVLPEHLHCIWTLPPGDVDYSLRWKMIKAKFSRQLPKTEQRSESRKTKGERGIWQRRYWEHTLRNDEDMRRHVDYIHYNPVKHGHVKRVSDWPYSSFHRFVREGWLAEDWAGGRDLEGVCGE